MRNYAKVNVSINDDPDWRALTRNAQHLYITLLISATINNAGVADWRPVRMSALAKGWCADEIIQDGKELELSRHIIVDEATEEVLVRSFVRSDGILDGPKTAQGMANAYRSVISLRIRAAICREVARMRREFPESGAWKVDDVVAIADLAVPEGDETGLSASIPAVPDALADTPSEGDCLEHAASIPLHQPSTTQPDNQTTKGKRRSRKAANPGTRLPADWQPTLDLIAWAKTAAPDVNGREETESFKDWWAAANGPQAIKRDWNAAFRTWMRRSQKDAGQRAPSGRSSAPTSARPNHATVRKEQALSVVQQLLAEENGVTYPEQLALGGGQ